MICVWKLEIISGSSGHKRRLKVLQSAFSSSEGREGETPPRSNELAGILIHLY